MKRIVYLILSAILICTALSVFSVPASAAQPSWSEIRSVIENAKSGDVLEFELDYRLTADMTVTVKVPCQIHFIGKTKSPCVISASDSGNTCFKIGANNVSIICENVVFDGFSTSSEGGFATVTGEKCIIDGIVCKNCTAGMSGGAITVRGKQFTATNSRFENCSSKIGGAIQFYSGATGGTVSKCTFTGCTATSGGNCVKGAYDTKVEGCTPTFNYTDYRDCEQGTSDVHVGSVLSDGNIWVIVAVAAVAVCAIAVLAVYKKKKEKAGK